MSFFCRLKRQGSKYAGPAVFLLLCGSSGVLSQSGRQPPKPTRYPLPSTSVSEPATTDRVANPNLGTLQQKTKVLIGRHVTKRRLQTEDVIFASFVNRLNGYANVEGLSLGNLKRAEATTRAKAESESFVVWLDFEVDRIQSGTIILNSPDLVIEYAVLAPQTGKQRTKGKVYFQAIGGGRMRKSEWPGGTPIRITPEAAGIEIAEHVYDWLRLDELRKGQMQK